MLLCFFFNDTATTEIYTLSLHDALPIYEVLDRVGGPRLRHDRLTDVENLRRLISEAVDAEDLERLAVEHHLQHADRVDRKSTRLNSSHANISYAVFCLKKKKRTHMSHTV